VGVVGALAWILSAGACSSDPASQASDAGAADTGPAPDSGPCTATGRPYEDGCFGADGTGVFVNAKAAAGGDGTKGKPFNNLQDALNKGGRIYVCEGEYTGSVTLTAASPASTVFGGLSCDGFGFAGKSVVLKGAVDLPALLLDGTKVALAFSDIEIAAPDAVGKEADGAGKSSVAVFGRNASATTFTRCTLRAGKGAPGAEGAAGTGYASAGKSGTELAAAGDGLCACGGKGAGGADTSTTGGAAGRASGQNGGPGLSSPAVPKDGARSGIGGEPDCTSGINGSNGLGQAGGTAAATPGTLTAQGWRSSDGNPGLDGLPGQAGGGGGGAGGGRGGWGACGGCGGRGGGGGAGGGAAVGLASFHSSFLLSGCTLITIGGGPGGPGGKGEVGAAGGLGDLGENGCGGGSGANGAGGAGGAGGTGGPSVGLLYAGAPPTASGLKFELGSGGGTGGSPGTPGPAATPSTPGYAGLPGGVGANGRPGGSLELLQAQ
jgi:hypothetical protein